MGTTSVNGWPTPETADVPNIVNATAAFNSIDQRVNPIFANVGTRDTALPTPTEGQECYVTGTGEKYVFRGGKWISSAPRLTYLTSPVVVTDSIALGGSCLSTPVEASSHYQFEGFLQVFSTGTTSNGYRLALLGPSAAVGYWGLTSIGGADMMAIDTGALTSYLGFGIVTTPGNLVHFTGWLFNTNAGNLTVRFSENAAVGGVTSVTTYTGSMLRIWKV